MLLVEIEKQVKPLSLPEKHQFIRDVQRMIEEETFVIYDIDTPNITVDEPELISVSHAVQQLRQEHPYGF